MLKLDQLLFLQGLLPVCLHAIVAEFRENDRAARIAEQKLNMRIPRSSLSFKDYDFHSFLNLPASLTLGNLPLSYQFDCQIKRNSWNFSLIIYFLVARVQR